MTRHQRRKAARARKNAKAELLNSRALALLQSEKLKRNLVERMPKQGLIKSSASRYTLGFSTRGADGTKLSQTSGKIVRNRSGGKKVKGFSVFDTSQIRDDVAIAGERISVSYAKARYAECVPNCANAGFKGPFKRKA
jgi:hypothetical protein